MNFSFDFIFPDGNPSDVRVIPGIPGDPIVRLEGRNGIGKTLAARLLELISGHTPFAALPHAWSSLITGLGTIDIRITCESPDLGLTQIDCHLVSDAWRGRTQEDVARDPGTVTVNLKTATWQEARSFFDIRRIAGDEGLQETLGRTLRERALLARREEQQRTERLQEWGRRLQPLHSALRGFASDVVDVAYVALRTAEAEASDTRESRNKLQNELNHARQREGTWARRRDQAVGAPRLLAEYGRAYDALESALRDAKAEEAALEAQIAQRTSTDEALQSTRHWSRLLQLRLRAAQLAGRDLKELEERAAGPSPAEDVTEGIAETKRQLEEKFTAGQVRGVIRDMSSPLARLSNPAVLDQEFLALERAVSGRILLAGLRRREHQLAGVPKNEEVLELESHLRLLEQQAQAIGDLPAARALLARKEANVEEALQRLDDLEASSAPEHSHSADLGASRETVARAGGEVALISSQLAGLLSTPDKAQPKELNEDEEYTEEQLAAAADESQFTPPGVLDAEYATLLEALQKDLAIELAADQEQLPAELELAISARVEFWNKEANRLAQQFGEATNAASTAQESYMQARARVDALLVDLAGAVSLLLQQAQIDPVWGVVMRELTNVEDLAQQITALASADSTGDQGQSLAGKLLHQLLRLDAALETIEDVGAQTRDAWSTVASFLEYAAVQLAPRLGAPDSQRLFLGAAPVRQLLEDWMEAELSGILSTAALRRELFDDADQVFFKLANLAVTWRTADGVRRRRPLEAFSSGEQVFAYTRAKLQRIQEERKPPSQIVLILDEFGAFVARDRFAQLLQYVQFEALGSIASKIVLMLPLGTDPSLILNAEYRRSVEAIGYFAAPGAVVTA